jgi:hypothetical protein
LVIGGGFAQTDTGRKLAALGAKLGPGVLDAAQIVCDRLASEKE